jgi:hypothetical protein
MEEYGSDKVDLLKLDVEGAEEGLFSHSDVTWIDRVNSLIVEVHSRFAYKLICDTLLTRGFSLSQRGEKLFFLRDQVRRPRSQN